MIGQTAFAKHRLLRGGCPDHGGKLRQVIPEGYPAACAAGCFVGCSRCDFVGVVVDPNGPRVEPLKIDATTAWVEYTALTGEYRKF